MSATKKLSAGVYQVVGTDFAIRNDSRNCWWVAKVIGGLDSYEPSEVFFIGGTRSDAITYAKELQVNS